VAVSQHRTSVLFTSHPKDGLVVNLYIPHNRRTPLQAEEALGPISIPRGSRGVDPFQRTSASRAEKPGAYSTPGTPSGRGGYLQSFIPKDPENELIGMPQIIMTIHNPEVSFVIFLCLFIIIF
jgi:hypothetical protein